MKSVRYSCPILMKFEFSRQFFEKYSNFHENPSSGGQVVSCGQTDGRTHMTKLTVGFQNYAKVPKHVPNMPPASKR